jgi:hypothetical protein
MALAALHLLPRVITGGAAAFGGYCGLAVARPLSDQPRVPLLSAYTRAPPCKTIVLLAAATDDSGGKRISATTLAYNPASQIAGQT